MTLEWSDVRGVQKAIHGIAEGDATWPSEHDRDYVLVFVDDAIAVIGALRACLLAAGVSEGTVDRIIETSHGGE
jgi:hypothetical protein